MIKILPLVVVGILAPPLAWLTFGGQLIYASRQARHRRFTENAHRLIQAHSAQDGLP